MALDTVASMLGPFEKFYAFIKTLYHFQHTAIFTFQEVRWKLRVVMLDKKFI